MKNAKGAKINKWTDLVAQTCIKIPSEDKEGGLMTTTTQEVEVAAEVTEEVTGEAMAMNLKGTLTVIVIKI